MLNQVLGYGQVRQLALKSEVVEYDQTVGGMDVWVAIRHDSSGQVRGQRVLSLAPSAAIRAVADQQIPIHDWNCVEQDLAWFGAHGARLTDDDRADLYKMGYTREGIAERMRDGQTIPGMNGN